MMRSARARWIALLAVALAAVAGSCTEISTNPATVTALEFDALPYPAVITGDSLRDSLGHPVPLQAIAFNVSGAALPGAPIQFFALDSGITIDPAGIVTAQLRNGTVRIVASAATVQSPPASLIVARRPDTVIVTPLANDTLVYAVPDTAARNITAPLILQVATRDTIGGVPGTQGWLVTYQLLFHGTALATTDTTIASLWNGANLATLVDTTDADGSASLRLRVRSTRLPTTPDSLTVIATVKYRGAPVAGSPVTYVIQIRPSP